MDILLSLAKGLGGELIDLIVTAIQNGKKDEADLLAQASAKLKAHAEFLDAELAKMKAGREAADKAIEDAAPKQ